jgi:hypothetical protein
MRFQVVMGFVQCLPDPVHIGPSIGQSRRFEPVILGGQRNNENEADDQGECSGPFEQVTSADKGTGLTPMRLMIGTVGIRVKAHPTR